MCDYKSNETGYDYWGLDDYMLSSIVTKESVTIASKLLNENVADWPPTVRNEIAPVLMNKLYEDLIDDERTFSESGKVNVAFIDEVLSGCPLTKRFLITMLKYQLTFFEVFGKFTQLDKAYMVKTYVRGEHEEEIQGTTS